ncbi:MAG: hypothetical protein M1812_004010 [Candelaria pacifica]|nr:MAG: hypothetical protein M1812_004010 [Candelaria pacifica]
MAPGTRAIKYIDSNGKPAVLEDYQIPIPTDGIGKDRVLTIAYFKRILRIDEQIGNALTAQMNPVPITALPQRQQDFRNEDIYLLDCREKKKWTIAETVEGFEKSYGKKLTIPAMQSRLQRAVERRVGEGRWDLQDLRALYSAASHVEAEHGRTIQEIRAGVGIGRKKWRHMKDKLMPLGASGVFGAHAIQVKYEQGLRFLRGSHDGEQEAEEDEEDD